MIAAAAQVRTTHGGCSVLRVNLAREHPQPGGGSDDDWSLSMVRRRHVSRSVVEQRFQRVSCGLCVATVTRKPRFQLLEVFNVQLVAVLPSLLLESENVHPAAAGPGIDHHHKIRYSELLF